MTTEDTAEGFLARWSRRKRQSAASAARGVEAPPAEAGSDASEALAPVAAVPEAAAAPALPDGAPPDAATAEDAAPPADGAPDPAAELPPVESLTAESDLRPFLQPRVPQALRQAALRRIWSLDPVIRDFVGPADYAWDFNAPDGVPGFALDLGGDAARLLAQAIGHLPPAGEAEATGVGGPEAADPEPGQDRTAGADPPAEAPPDEPPAAPETPPAAAEAEPDRALPDSIAPFPAPTGGGAPRRHGRALPV
jgi:hypothetical protein